MNYIYKWLFTLIGVGLFFQCENTNATKTNKKSNQIVIIYNNQSIKDSLSLLPNKVNSPKAIYTPVVTYTLSTDIFDEKVIIFDSKTKLDTIKIKTETPIILNHKYNLEDLYFYVKPGDTLKYNTHNNIPIYESLIKEDNDSQDFIVEAIFRGGNYEFQSIDFHYNQVRSLILNNQKKEKFNKEYLAKWESTHSKINAILDSLSKEKKISVELYNMYAKKNKYDSINLLFNEDIFSKTNHSVFQEYIKNDDSFLKYKFYKQFLHNFIERKFDIKDNKVGQAVLIDARQAYDSIKKNDYLFNEKTKSYLLYYYLNQIIENYSVKVSKKYIEDFDNSTSFEAPKNKIKDKYLVDFINLKEKRDSVILINKYKEKINLKELIAKNEGKVIYIDFWASWCAPCIKEFPNSKKLIQKFKNRDVVFIYISLDKNMNGWLKAKEKENLLSYNNSFLAVNYPNADFYKKLNLKDIPRYLIYDNEGELLYKSAPNPSSNKTESILNELLKNK